jgi:chloramphenicol 3-O phosphotransferase
MHFDIIWLNGTSSSGKTTLAKELQTLLDEHFLHVCFDTFYQMLPARFKPTTPADSKYVERVHLGFEYSIPALAKGGNRLIVDYPFHYADSLPRCLDLVSGYTVFTYGSSVRLRFLNNERQSEETEKSDWLVISLRG